MDTQTRRNYFYQAVNRRREPDLTGNYIKQEIVQRGLSATIKETEDTQCICGMKKALHFWRVIRNFNFGESRREILSHYVENSNRYISIIAKIELLPDSAFRKVLWFYNIDFQSFEAFLRRLTEDQVAGINEAYDSLFGKETKLPECFTKGFKNKFRRLLSFSSETVEGLSDSTYGDKYSDRYQSKGSIAYEFFYMDFGFSNYRHEGDDNRISESKSTRFLSKWDKSLKKGDRENEFVVNQEGGLYWWLYRTIRSNPIWFPNCQIHLKPAICPGFWYTLVIWTLILFISPTATITTYLFWGSSLWLTIPIGVAGAITPFILSALTGKYLFIKLVDLLEKVVGEISEDYCKTMAVTLGVIIVSVACSFLAYIFWKVMVAWCYGSGILATYLTAFVFVYVFNVIYGNRFTLPTSIPYFGIPTVIFVTVKALFDYQKEILWFVQKCSAVIFMAIVTAFDWLVSFFVEYQFAILYVLAMVAMVVTINFVLNKLDKQKKDIKKDKETYQHFERFYKRAVRSVWTIFGFLFVYLGYKSFETMSFQIILSLLGLLVLPGAMMVLFFYLLGRFEPKVVLQADNFKTAALAFKKEEIRFCEKMAQNSWLKTDPQAKIKFDKILKFLQMGSISFDEVPSNFFSMDRGIFNLIDGFEEGFRRDGYFYHHNLRYLELMLLGYSFDLAHRTIQFEIEKKKQGSLWYQFNQNILEPCGSFLNKFVFLPVFWLITKLFINPVVCSLRFVKRIISDGYTLFVNFNERCQGVSQTKNLGFD